MSAVQSQYKSINLMYSPFGFKVQSAFAFLKFWVSIIGMIFQSSQTTGFSKIFVVWIFEVAYSWELKVEVVSIFVNQLEIISFKLFILFQATINVVIQRSLIVEIFAQLRLFVFRFNNLRGFHLNARSGVKSRGSLLLFALCIHKRWSSSNQVTPEIVDKFKGFTHRSKYLSWVRASRGFASTTLLRYKFSFVTFVAFLIGSISTIWL